MGQTVTASNNVAVNFQQVVSPGFSTTSPVAVPVPLTFKSVFQAAGAIIDTCNLLYATTLTLAATPTTLNLISGLFDPAGLALVFARVKVFAIRVNSTTDGQVCIVGAAGSNEWNGIVSNAGTFKVGNSTTKNDGFVIFQSAGTTGFASIDATHKLIKLDPGASTFTIDILIAGCDA